MKKTLLLCGVLLAVSASVASAAGMNLGWNDCPAGVTYLRDVVFACNTNSNASAHTMFVSFKVPVNVGTYVSNQATIELQSNGAVLPPWWGLKGTGQCRTGQGVADANFASGPFSCNYPWFVTATGSLASENDPYLTPNHGRMNFVFAVGSADAQPLAADGTEYYAFKMLVTNTKTVGTGSCAGCQDGVCLVLTDVKVIQPAGSPGGDTDIHNVDISNFITWNGPTTDTCAGATPTKNTTWGSIKALYR